MTECWSEGALRAYLDRELPTEDMQRVAAHLGECKVCDGLCTELAARAAHVSALLELLPEWSAAMPRPAIVAKRRPHWIGIAAALAAGLAVAAYLLADRTPREAIVLPTPVRVADTAAGCHRRGGSDSGSGWSARPASCAPGTTAGSGAGLFRGPRRRAV